MPATELTVRRPTANRAVLPRAQMAELVDAPASGAGDRKVVEVRVLFWAPFLDAKGAKRATDFTALSTENRRTLSYETQLPSPAIYRSG